MKHLSKRSLLKVIFLIISTDIIESVAELFFKRGALSTGIKEVTLANFFTFCQHLVNSPNTWIGVFFYILNFFLWIAVLSRADLSFAFPVGSTTYIIVPILSIFFLHEKVTLVRWAGIGLIIAGILLVAQSNNFNQETS